MDLIFKDTYIPLTMTLSNVLLESAIQFKKHEHLIISRMNLTANSTKIGILRIKIKPRYICVHIYKIDTRFRDFHDHVNLNGGK